MLRTPRATPSQLYTTMPSPQVVLSCRWDKTYPEVVMEEPGTLADRFDSVFIPTAVPRAATQTGALRIRGHRFKFSQKPKELRSANREACTSRKYQTRRFISGQSKTEQVLEKHQHCRELKDQQLQPTQWTHQHQSAPRGHQPQSSLRCFLPFKNLAPPTSNKTLLAPAGSELYANQRQIKPHLSKEKSSDLQADSNSTYMNFDPVLSQYKNNPVDNQTWKSCWSRWCLSRILKSTGTQSEEMVDLLLL
uniref:uncharacterized protein n=1 Tax=Pristiophorus japonicus TaxID=55135 RepID=UPI00398F8952